MAKTKVVVDPITRIEGHLRIEAQSENGMISTAWADRLTWKPGTSRVLTGSSSSVIPASASLGAA